MLFNTEYDASNQLFKIKIGDLTLIPPLTRPEIYTIDYSFRIKYMPFMYDQHEVFMLTNTSLIISTMSQNYTIILTNVIPKFAELLTNHFVEVEEKYNFEKTTKKEKADMDAILDKPMTDLFRWWLNQDEKRRTYLYLTQATRASMSKEDIQFFLRCVENFEARKTSRRHKCVDLCFEYFTDGFGDDYCFISHISLALCIHLLRNKKAKLYRDLGLVVVLLGDKYKVVFLPQEYEQPTITVVDKDPHGLIEFIHENNMDQFLTFSAPKLRFIAKPNSYYYYIEEIESKCKSISACNVSIGRDELLQTIHTILEQEPCSTGVRDGILRQL